MLDSDAEVGRVIAELRGERSQQSVAVAMRQLGWRWSQATVWSVEKGERPLRLREAVDLASILGTTVEIMAGVDPDLVLLANKLPHAREKIGALKKQMMALEQQVAETKAKLESSQHERLALEDAFRKGVEASGLPSGMALLAGSS